MAVSLDGRERALLERLKRDDDLAQWARELRGEDTPSGFWGSPETKRALVTTLMIPALIWLGGYAWSLTPPGSAAAKEAKQREEMDEVAKLMPIGLQSDNGRLVVTAVLKARSTDPNGIVAQTLTVLAQTASTQAAPAPSVAPDRAVPPTTSAPPDTKKGESLLANPVAAPSIVYMQIYSEADRPAAQRLSDALAARYVPVAGIENFRENNPQRSLRLAQKRLIGARYFHATDRNAAEYVAAQIDETLPGEGVVIQNAGALPAASAVKPGVIEIWFPYRGG